MKKNSIYQPTMFEKDLEEQALLNEINELEDFVSYTEHGFIY